MKQKLRVWVRLMAGLLFSAGLIWFSNGKQTAEELLNLEVSDAEEYEADPEEEPVTLREWKKINPRVKYVLTFQDDAIQRVIPVIAANDVSYAMKHNIRGEYDSMGSVFCDPSALEPANLVIYGHSSRTKDWCFTFLKQYTDPAYYAAHPTLRLEEESGITTCRIVSAAVYDMKEDSYVGWADSALSAGDEIRTMFQETVPYLVNQTGGQVYRGEGVLTLVTCDMRAEDARIVVQALREL